MPRTRLVALALAASALAATGCGKSSSTNATQSQSSTTTQTPTATQSAATEPANLETNRGLIDEANAHCRRLLARRESIRAETLPQIAQVSEELARFERIVVAEMRGLHPSDSSLANNWQQIVLAAQTIADDTAKIGEYAKTNQYTSKASLMLLHQVRALEIHAHSIAKHAGITECATNLW